MTDAGLVTVQMGTECACHKHREYVPTEKHHVWPLGMGGPNVEANKILVCANAHYSIHAVIDLLIKHDGNPPTEQMRKFGYKVRRYAKQGYSEWKAHQ